MGIIVGAGVYWLLASRSVPREAAQTAGQS
jgi:hypothetical protein